MCQLVYGALKTGDPKSDIPDPAHRSWGGLTFCRVPERWGLQQTNPGLRTAVNVIKLQTV